MHRGVVGSYLELPCVSATSSLEVPHGYVCSSLSCPTVPLVPPGSYPAGPLRLSWSCPVGTLIPPWSCPTGQLVPPWSCPAGPLVPPWSCPTGAWFLTRASEKESIRIKLPPFTRSPKNCKQIFITRSPFHSCTSTTFSQCFTIAPSPLHNMCTIGSPVHISPKRNHNLPFL
jgi:hypothetical protein